jgi:hypothetical protein
VGTNLVGKDAKHGVSRVGLGGHALLVDALPLLETLKGARVGDVVDQDAHVRASIEHSAERLEAVLPR